MVLKKQKLLLVASLASTLWVFYRGLIERLREMGYEVTVAASDDYDLGRFERQFGCTVFPINISRRIAPFQDLACMVRLIQLMRKERFDLVHAHTPKGGLVGMTAAVLAHVPNRVYTLHGLPMETATGVGRKLLWCCEKFSCRLATRLLAVSQSLRDKVVEENLCMPKKISVLEKGTACGIDLGRFMPQVNMLEQRTSLRQKFRISQDGVVIGFVGRLTPEKGVDALLHCFLELETSYRELYLMLVGDFDNIRQILNSKTKEIIQSHPQIVQVDFQADVVPFYAAMDLFVMPTRREGFGMTFLEAGAMELPVIGTRVTGCVDAIVDGETGFLVKLDDKEELTKTISKLVADKELRFRLGRNGRERVEKYFYSEKLVKAHIDFYNQLL